MKVATRGSALALAQVNLVEAALGVPLQRVVIESHGDRSLDRDLIPGAFTRAVDEAVLAGTADLAVHSLKDLPVETPEGLVLAAVLPRAAAGDVLVVLAEAWVDAPWPLRVGSRVGTSSARRTALLRAADPAAQPIAIRGNVPTRLSRLGADLDAVVLAEAGLSRLGWPLPAGVRVARLDLQDWPCAPGQGAIAVHVRAGQARLLSLLARVDHVPTRAAVGAERARMREAGVGCHSAFAAWTDDGCVVGEPEGEAFLLRSFDRNGAPGPIRAAGVPRWAPVPPADAANAHSELWARAVAVAPGGVHSPVRAFRGLQDTPRFIRRGRGARLEGEGGERWLDLCNGWGAHILGHDHPAVREAIARALGNGTSFGAPTRAEVDYAERLGAALGPLSMVRFTCSGAEAVSTALRIARHATGRRRVLRFDGGYHGHGDAVVEGEGGIVVPFNNEEAFLTALRAHAHDVAAVLVEAVPANEGLLPQREDWWRMVEVAPRAAGALLVVDEVITAFRLRYGAAHPLYGVAADLVTLGKIVGGGLPLAAVAGPPKWMRLLSPSGPAFHAGTMTAHPLAVAAGQAVLEVLENPKVYAELEQRASAFQAASRLPWTRVGSMLWPWLGEAQSPLEKPELGSAAERFVPIHAGALRAGVYLPPAAGEVSFVSLAHELEDLVAAARVIDSFAYPHD